MPEPTLGAVPNTLLFTSGFELPGGLPNPPNEKPAASFLLFPPPKRLPPLPVLLTVPKSDEAVEALVDGEAPKLNFCGSDMLKRFVGRYAAE